LPHFGDSTDSRDAAPKLLKGLAAIGSVSRAPDFFGKASDARFKNPMISMG
jgi:hypothetical protein